MCPRQMPSVWINALGLKDITKISHTVININKKILYISLTFSLIQEHSYPFLTLHDGENLKSQTFSSKRHRNQIPSKSRGNKYVRENKCVIIQDNLQSPTPSTSQQVIFNSTTYLTKEQIIFIFAFHKMYGVVPESCQQLFFVSSVILVSDIMRIFLQACSQIFLLWEWCLQCPYCFTFEAHHFFSYLFVCWWPLLFSTTMLECFLHFFTSSNIICFERKYMFDSCSRNQQSYYQVS